MTLERIAGLLSQVAGAARVESVYGESREAAGKTIIPVAKVSYCGGGGGGTGKQGQTGEGLQEGVGGGGGLGVKVEPLGCFVITEQAERWVPAVDVTKLLMAGALVAIAAIWTLKKIATRQRG